MERVIAYVDGYNLYYGLRQEKWRRYYWLNIQAMARNLLKPGQVLVATKYFTTIVSQPRDKRKRQAVFLEALQTLNDLHIFYGHFLADPVTCHKCGHTYVTHHEKMTDVNISVELMSDSYEDRFDMALLVTGDGDLVGPVKAVRRLFKDKRVICVFPPGRSSKALRKAANAHLHIERNILAKSQLPEQVVKPDGFVLSRPAEWR